MPSWQGCASPRFASRRTDRPTHGPAVKAVAEALSFPPMAWQQGTFDVALEHDGTGLPAYRDVILSIMRQQGKTSGVFCLIMWRMLTGQQRVVYGAQTRLAARTRLFEVWWPKIRRSPFRDMFTLSRATGAETLRCSNGSTLTLLSTEEAAGHGETLDLAVLDECWSLDAAAEQACRPAMLTRPAAQLWMVSTAGTNKSAWWRSKVDAGRTVTAAGIDAGFCYLEWSASDDEDPTDEDTWRACMPALGVTCQPETLRADMGTMSLPDFRRAYLNQWPEVAAEGWAVISRDLWEAARL